MKLPVAVILACSDCSHSRDADTCKHPTFSRLEYPHGRELEDSRNPPPDWCPMIVDVDGGFEPKCQKLRWPIRAAADFALERTRRHPHTAAIPTRSYHCKRCRGWHLTSKHDDRGLRGDEDRDLGPVSEEPVDAREELLDRHLPVVDHRVEVLERHRLELELRLMVPGP